MAAIPPPPPPPLPAVAVAPDVVADEENIVLENDDEEEDEGESSSQKKELISDIATIQYTLSGFTHLACPVKTSQCFKAHNLVWRLLFVLQKFSSEESSSESSSHSSDHEEETGDDDRDITVFILSYNETSETWGSTHPGKFVAKFGSTTTTTTNEALLAFDEDCKFQIKKKDIIANCLDDEGNWIISIDIQIYVDSKKKNKPAVWYPKFITPKEDGLKNINNNNNFQCKQMLESPKYADVIFLVGSTKTKFHAHRSVLYHQAPMLHDLVESSNSVTTATTSCGIEDDDDDDISNAIEIPNIMESTFKSLLEYIYTGKLPEILVNGKTTIHDDHAHHGRNENEHEEENENDVDTSTTASAIITAAAAAKDLLYATDKFGLTNVKLYLESEIISKLLTLQTAAEWLLIADGHTCALLKEICMGMYIDNPTSIQSTSGWNDIRKSPELLMELLDYALVGKMFRFKPIGPHDYCNMDVQTLREKLDLVNLDVDGSRDVLIKRLEDHYNASVASTLSNPTKTIQLLR